MLRLLQLLKGWLKNRIFNIKSLLKKNNFDEIYIKLKVNL